MPNRVLVVDDNAEFAEAVQGGSALSRYRIAGPDAQWAGGYVTGARKIRRRVPGCQHVHAGRHRADPKNPLRRRFRRVKVTCNVSIESEGAEMKGTTLDMSVDRNGPVHIRRRRSHYGGEPRRPSLRI
jgi:hypothetical protein